MSEDQTNVITAPHREYVVACIVCGERKPVMLYPHYVNDKIVGWVFVCLEDQDKVQGASMMLDTSRTPEQNAEIHQVG